MLEVVALGKTGPFNVFNMLPSDTPRYRVSFLPMSSLAFLVYIASGFRAHILCDANKAKNNKIVDTLQIYFVLDTNRRS